MPGQILLTREGELATLVISNPEKLNALDREMWDALHAHLRDLTAEVAEPTETSLRCLCIKGDGERAFAAGGDLEEFSRVRMTIDAAMAYHSQSVGPALQSLADFPLPVVAQIQGPCIGGGLEIACCCDIRITSDAASFGAPILKLGFNMYAGEMAHVLAAIPAAVAAEILLEGRILDAPEALSKGLVSRCVPDAQLEDEVLATCRRISQGAPLVARAHKVWLRRLRQPAPLTTEELRASLSLVSSDDYRAGLDAFFKKERPRFRGR